MTTGRLGDAKRCARLRAGARAIKDASAVDLSRRPTRVVKKSTKVDELGDGADDRQREDRGRGIERAKPRHLVIGRQADRGLRHRDERWRSSAPSPSSSTFVLFFT